MPGDHGKVHVTLTEDMALEIGQNFTVRENNRTIATGKIIEFLPSILLKTPNLGKLRLPYGVNLDKNAQKDSG